MSAPLVADEVLYKQKDLIRVIAGGATQVLCDPDGHGDYLHPADALADITDEGPAKRYTLLCNGRFTGKQVDLRRHFCLAAARYAFGPSVFGAEIRYDGGHAVRMAPSDAGVFGMRIVADSGDPADAALYVTDDGAGAPSVEAFVKDTLCRGESGCRGMIAEHLIADWNLVCIYAGVDGSAGGSPASRVEDGGVIFYLGGMGGDADTGISIGTGGFVIIGGPFNASAEPTAGRVVDNDAGFFICQDSQFGEAANGYRGRNGALAILAKVQCFGGYSNLAVETDGASPVFVGDVNLDGLGATVPYANWSAAGPLIQLYSGLRMAGTTAPDQRPANAPEGFVFLARDLGAAGLPLWRTAGGQWIDATGAVVP